MAVCGEKIRTTEGCIPRSSTNVNAENTWPNSSSGSKASSSASGMRRVYAFTNA